MWLVLAADITAGQSWGIWGVPQWILALVALVTGIVLGMWTSAYRSVGQPRDELRVREIRLRSRMESDQEIDSTSFNEMISEYLIDLDSGIRTQTWDEARRAMDQAESTFDKWRKWRGDWLALLKSLDALRQQAAGLNGESVCVQEIVPKLEPLERSAPRLLKNPDELRDQLDKHAKVINRYATLEAKWKQLNRLRQNLAEDKDDVWRLKERELLRALLNLSPADQQTVYATLDDSLIAGLDAVAKLPRLAAEVEATSAKEAVQLTSVPRVRPASESRFSRIKSSVASPEWRLILFRWVGYSVTMGLLVQVGYKQLYFDKLATFKSGDISVLWDNYFALLLWGFGSEAGRKSVTDAIRNWGGPTAQPVAPPNATDKKTDG